MAQSAYFAIQGLRRKIILSAVLYSLAALLLIAALSAYPLYRTMRHFEENNLLHAVRFRALAIEEYLTRVSELARQINSRTEIRLALEQFRRGEMRLGQLRIFTRPRLQDALQISEEIVGITRMARNQVISENGQGVTPKLAASLSASARELALLNPVAIDDELYLVVVSPIFAANSDLIGHDIVLFTTGKLQRIIWDQAGLGVSGESFLGRRENGNVTLFFPGRKGEREVYNREVPDSPLQSAFSLAASGETGILRLSPGDLGEKNVVAYAGVAGTDWGILISINDRELMAPLRRQALSVAAMALVLTALGALGLWGILRPMTGRVLVYTEELDKLNHELQQEIAERKRAENSLRRSEREWEQTFNAITDAVAIMDLNGNVLRMNRASSDLIGEMKKGPAGESGYDLLFGFSSARQDCPFFDMLREKEPQCTERHDPVSDRWFHVAIYPLVDESHTLWGGVHIAHEVTEQKKMERAKDEMISAVSHEMRTPLTAMLGFVEFLLENPVERELQIDYLKTVYQETERLNELISNFLDLQRLQAEIGHYEFARIDVCDLLDEAAHLYQVASKKHAIAIDCPMPLPMVRGDEKRLMQVMKNLLSNAIKYSPQGGTVTLGAENADGAVTIFVRDEGLGIPARDRERIFERFYRVDDSEKRIPGGIGLGLALVREVVKAHGGRVWVESEMGKGSTFFFTVPHWREMALPQEV